jgi:hypothetical protein
MIGKFSVQGWVLNTLGVIYGNEKVLGILRNFGIFWMFSKFKIAVFTFVYFICLNCLASNTLKLERLKVSVYGRLVLGN